MGVIKTRGQLKRAMTTEEFPVYREMCRVRAFIVKCFDRGTIFFRKKEQINIFFHFPFFPLAYSGKVKRSGELFSAIMSSGRICPCLDLEQKKDGRLNAGQARKHSGNNIVSIRYFVIKPPVKERQAVPVLPLFLFFLTLLLSFAPPTSKLSTGTACLLNFVFFKYLGT